MKKGFKKFFCFLLICSLAVTTLIFSGVSVSAAEPYSAYVMGYFKESPDDSDNNPYLHLSVSTDGRNWTPLNQNNAVLKAPNAKHATITSITSTEYNNLIAKWGTPNWTRLKSYNYPDRYVRHSNNVASIDPSPFDPTADMQWKPVAGLADPDGVSFQSVNNPNYYLRHFNYSLVLNQNDNSEAFKADATFYKTAGFADSSWTSFKSYNFPDRYIRQLNYVLRIDPISSSSPTDDKEDATFRLCYSESVTLPQSLVGDLNGDNSVDATDYALMKKYLLGSIYDFPIQNDLEAGDLNLDGVIGALDFAVYKKSLLGTK